MLSKRGQSYSDSDHLAGLAAVGPKEDHGHAGHPGQHEYRRGQQTYAQRKRAACNYDDAKAERQVAVAPQNGAWLLLRRRQIHLGAPMMRNTRP